MFGTGSFLGTGNLLPNAGLDLVIPCIENKRGPNSLRELVFNYWLYD
jgi:hypothetical protein